ncbi:MAG TPA: cupredoxin family copper-binding protein [Albitalea sp.]
MASWAAAVAVAAMLAVSAAAPHAAPRQHTVVIEGMAFRPATLTVKRGDRIAWVNRDLVPHTATAAAFDTGRIEAGRTRTLTVRQAGALDYDCAYHPTMKARVVVEP